MSLSNEIFGFEDSPKPSPAQPKAEPTLSIDDWRWRSESPSGSPLATLSKIENTAFADAIAGESDTAETALQDFDALTEFRKVVPLPTPLPSAPLASAELSKFANRAGKIAERAPERKQVIATILEKFKAKLGGGGSMETWDRLARSCEAYVSASLLEVA